MGVNADLLVRMQTDYNIQVARKNNSLREKLNNIKENSCRVLKNSSWYDIIKTRIRLLTEHLKQERVSKRQNTPL